MKFYFLFFFPVYMFSQSHDVLIKDIVTGAAIPDVNVQYSKLNEGTISNLDGMVRIATQDTITLSHLSYTTKKTTYAEYGDNKIIYLDPGEISLDEVVVSNFDLKFKLKFVLENYRKLYVNGEKSYLTTYKETFRANDSLVRLFQVKAEWWNVDYEMVFEKSLTKQNHFQLTSTDFKKLEALDNDFQVAIKNQDFLKSLFLNHHLYFMIYFTKEISIHSINKQKYATKVVFSAPIEDKGIILRYYENCEVYFDNITGAVLKLKSNVVERDDAPFDDAKFASGKRGLAKTEVFTSEVSFVEANNKLRLTKFNLQLKALLKTEGVTTRILHEQSFFINKFYDGQRIAKNQRINLYKYSFFESIPELMTNNPTILLTQEEMEFMQN